MHAPLGEQASCSLSTEPTPGSTRHPACACWVTLGRQKWRSPQPHLIVPGCGPPAHWPAAGIRSGCSPRSFHPPNTHPVLLNTAAGFCLFVCLLIPKHYQTLPQTFVLVSYHETEAERVLRIEVFQSPCPRRPSAHTCRSQGPHSRIHSMSTCSHTSACQAVCPGHRLRPVLLLANACQSPSQPEPSCYFHELFLPINPVHCVFWLDSLPDPPLEASFGSSLAELMNLSLSYVLESPSNIKNKH